MAKKRKRTSKDIPAKDRLRDMADRLWSLSVRADWCHKCAVCGFGKCEAHHLVPRQFEATRFELRNGIALCTNHHKFDRSLSPHQNAAGWIEWLQENHRELALWYMVNNRPPFTGTKTADYYIGHILRLRQYVEAEQFERICGIKFTAYLESNYEP